MNIQKITHHTPFTFYVFIFWVIILIPAIFSLNTIDPGLLPKFLILSAGLLWILVYSTGDRLLNKSNKYDTFPLNLIHVSLLGYLFFTFFSFIQAINSAEALFEAAKTLLFVIFTIAASRLLPSYRPHWHIAVKSIILLTLIYTLLGIAWYWNILQFFNSTWLTPQATFGNRNLFTSFLLLCSGFVLYGVFHFPRVWHIVSIAAYAALTYMFLIAQTRAVWLGVATGIVITAITVFIVRSDKGILFVKKQKWTIGLLCIIVIMFSLLHTHVRSSNEFRGTLANRISSMSNTENMSNNQRLQLWKKTGAMIRDNWLIGVGAGNWKINLPRYRMTGLLWQDMTTIEVRPYNDFLWVGAETGVIGMLCYIGIFLFAALQCVKKIRRKQPVYDSMLPVCLLYTVIGFSIVSSLSFPRERIEHLVFFGIVLAFILADPSNTIYTMPVPKKNFYVAHSFLIIAVTGCLVFGFKRLGSELHMRNILIARQQGNWQQVISEADAINPFFYSVDHTSTPVSWYRGVSNYVLKKNHMALEDFKKAHTQHPYHIHVLNNLGSCHEALGNHDKAIKWYRKALYISPHFSETLINLSAVLFNLNEFQKAYETITLVNDTCPDPRREKYLTVIESKLSGRNR